MTGVGLSDIGPPPQSVYSSMASFSPLPSAAESVPVVIPTSSAVSTTVQAITIQTVATVQQPATTIIATPAQSSTAVASNAVLTQPAVTPQQPITTARQPSSTPAERSSAAATPNQVFSTLATSSLTSEGATATGSTSVSGQDSNQATPPKPSSNAAAIGGGVGGAVAVLLLGLLAFLLWRRRSKKNKQDEKDQRWHNEGNADIPPYTSPAVPQSPKSAMSSPSELKGESALISRVVSPDFTGKRNPVNNHQSWSSATEGSHSRPAHMPGNPYPQLHELSGEQPAYMNMSAANEIYAGMPPAELSGGRNTFKR